MDTIFNLLKEKIVLRRNLSNTKSGLIETSDWIFPDGNVSFYYHKDKKGATGPGFETQISTDNGLVLLGALASNYSLRYNGRSPKTGKLQKNAIRLYSKENESAAFIDHPSNDLRALLSPWRTEHLEIRTLKELENLGSEIWQKALSPLFAKQR